MRVKTARDDDDGGGDKDWARRYILDPLTAPEPSQETGPGASHAHRRRAASPPWPASHGRPTALGTKEAAEAEADADADDGSGSSAAYSYPTPPSSASPTRGRFHHHRLHPSNPFAAAGATSYPHQQFQPSLLDTHDEEGLVTPPGSPPQTLSLHRRDALPILIAPPEQQQQQKQRHQHQQHQHQHQLQQHRRYPSVPLAGAPSWADADPDHPRRPRSSTSTSTSTNTNTNTNLRRQPSLHQRFPGDMSHRPLDMLKADARAAERRPPRHRKRLSETDTIDALDTIGGAYHHGGPFDATLASRNLDDKYSPVAAVRASNLEALRATPRENIADSLQRHVPLQGVASVPAGATDLAGKVMRYAEGADLMREPDAPGGAYGRWPGVAYHPDDLKGKGEPSFTVERALKAGEHRRGEEPGPDAYEMQQPGRRRRDPGKLAPAVRQRSASNAADEASSSGAAYGSGGGAGDLQRSHSTGKKISEGLKRRFGSLRRKKASAEED